jgi:hypothetical protein
VWWLVSVLNQREMPQDKKLVCTLKEKLKNRVMIVILSNNLHVTKISQPFRASGYLIWLFLALATCCLLLGISVIFHLQCLCSLTVHHLRFSGGKTDV